MRNVTAPSAPIACTTNGLFGTPMSPVLVLLCIAAVVVAGFVLEYLTHRETYRSDREQRKRDARPAESSANSVGSNRIRESSPFWVRRRSGKSAAVVEAPPPADPGPTAGVSSRSRANCKGEANSKGRRL